MKMTSETFKAAFGRNPVPKPTQDALKPGMYRATLESIDMVQVDVWENGVKTGAQEEKFDFTFRLENGTILHKKVRPKMSVKSDCLKLLYRRCSQLEFRPISLSLATMMLIWI